MFESCVTRAREAADRTRKRNIKASARIRTVSAPKKPVRFCVRSERLLVVDKAIYQYAPCSTRSPPLGVSCASGCVKLPEDDHSIQRHVSSSAPGMTHHAQARFQAACLWAGEQVRVARVSREQPVECLIEHVSVWGTRHGRRAMAQKEDRGRRKARGPMRNKK